MLERIARALYGERWQRPLARAMGVDPKQICRWVNYSDSHWNAKKFIRSETRVPLDDQNGTPLDKNHEFFADAMELLQQRQKSIGEVKAHLTLHA